MQEVLLANPRKAKEVGVVERLMRFRPHEALIALAKETEKQSAYAVLESQARLFAGWLGFEIETEESVWTQFPPRNPDDLALYEAVRGLSDHELDQLETLLSALVFGQIVCQRLDAEDSLFNRVARDLSVDMRNHWRPDRSFFERRTRDQLVAIAVDCGYAEGVGRLPSYKKEEPGRVSACKLFCRASPPGDLIFVEPRVDGQVRNPNASLPRIFQETVAVG